MQNDLTTFTVSTHKLRDQLLEELKSRPNFSLKAGVKVESLKDFAEDEKVILTTNLDSLHLLKKEGMVLPLLAVKGYSTLFKDLKFDMGT